MNDFYSEFNFPKDCKYVYFDSDLRKIQKSVKELSDTLKTITRRFEHKTTITACSSIFNYLERKNALLFQPSLFYDFRYNDVRISIFYEHIKATGEKFYTVCCRNYHPTYKSLNGCVSAGDFYGKFDGIDSAISLYCRILREFVLDMLGELF